MPSRDHRHTDTIRMALRNQLPLKSFVYLEPRPRPPLPIAKPSYCASQIASLAQYSHLTSHQNRGASLDAYDLTSDMVRFLQTVDGRIDAFHPRLDLQ